MLKLSNSNFNSHVACLYQITEKSDKGFLRIATDADLDMQQDDFRALLSAPRASGGSSRYDQTVALGRKASRQGTSAKDALALPPRSHSKSGQSKTGTSNSGAGAVSGGRLGASASEERLGVDKVREMLKT